MNGTVHTIRDMGEVAFVILRRRDGLLQCVFEEGVTAFDLKDIERGVQYRGRCAAPMNKEERAPHGI